LLPHRRNREIQLVRLEVDFARGEIWTPFTVIDRNLYTGQNPASAASLWEELGKVANYQWATACVSFLRAVTRLQDGAACAVSLVDCLTRT
jgi:hypothetical protein